MLYCWRADWQRSNQTLMIDFVYLPHSPFQRLPFRKTQTSSDTQEWHMCVQRLALPCNGV